MQKAANQIQKERIKQIEEKANKLLQKCTNVSLASITEKGYPRVCTITKVKADSFLELYFFTSKRSKINGKATHFENNPKSSICYGLNGDSVTLIGNIEIITDMNIKQTFDKYCDRHFFKKGIHDPKCYLLKFTTNEATFWIKHKFRTCKYKKVIRRSNEQTNNC